jgi:hypothetical protein
MIQQDDARPYLASYLAAFGVALVAITSVVP